MKINTTNSINFGMPILKYGKLDRERDYLRELKKTINPYSSKEFKEMIKTNLGYLNKIDRNSIGYDIDIGYKLPNMDTYKGGPLQSYIVVLPYAEPDKIYPFEINAIYPFIGKKELKTISEFVDNLKEEIVEICQKNN